ncbi:MAG: hypothetical protein HY545_00020 [Candidatus Doudnabacteria bacterium]|nr:hypothetical protein [Candidatus Doudnabacteria bacterium]
MPTSTDQDKGQEQEIEFKLKPVDEPLQPGEVELARIRVKVPLKEKEEDDNDDDNDNRQQSERPDEIEEEQGEPEEKIEERTEPQEEERQPREEQQGVDEQLQEYQHQQERRDQLEQMKQQERLGKDLAQREARKQAMEFAEKSLVRTGAGAAGTGGAAAAGTGAAAGAGAAGGAAAGGAAAGAAVSAPVWGTVLAVIGVIVGIILLVVLVITLLTATCNQSGFKGWVASWGSWGAYWLGLIPEDVCAQLSFSGGQSGGAGAGSSFGFDIVITSAYRPGAVTIQGKPSAHGRGEAVDIALRNPTVPLFGSDPRIQQLMAMAASAGIDASKGDILNEYAEPECELGSSSCGGHVHIEFNTYTSGGKTYTFCDNTEVKIPPNDLVSLVGSVPIEGASNPSVRPCMFDVVINIFNQTGS